MTMQKLTQYLSNIGYADLCSSFFPGAPRLSNWLNVRDNITDPVLRRFYRLLLINEAVDDSDFLPEEMACLTPFIAKQVIRHEHGQLKAQNMSLLVVMGNWLLFETPNPNPKVYYGDDSFGLLSRLRPQMNGATLDLCAGPGVQSIYSAAKASRVVSVEINPVSAAIAEINRELNQLDHWDIRVGDLYHALQPDESFDHIVCNPPLLPFPDDIEYPFVGHGGHDGWAVSWQVLDGLPHHLNDGGLAQIIGTTLSDGIEPIIMERLRQWARATQMDCHLSLIAQHPLKPGCEYFDGLIFSAAAMGAAHPNQLTERFEQFLAEFHVSMLVSHVLSVHPGRGKVMVTDFFHESRGSSGLWYI
ncbi:N5-glutamine S-adenosyl-L-methionine-dependent methyltransferase [Vibrio ruber DSM 16370]|uniref:N5-glutamine S-adenosyl-L-methionine-dependent methyltransferase n=2 Tax=Vibrio ruber TaxID=184755 RepID=A0A1R4LRJ1_VIBR1|nr:N5-glutamine S-adenosyl-L-methionine-dependent methyltransferase [Vibrio ruber DSM 16370]